LVLAARYRAAELAKINEFERRFIGHLTAVVDNVNAHTDAALEPLVARAEGRLPPMREGQTIAQRKTEVDLAMVSLRSERRELVAAENGSERSAGWHSQRSGGERSLLRSPELKKRCTCFDGPGGRSMRAKQEGA
jgi:hypothetical protein